MRVLPNRDVEVIARDFHLLLAAGHGVALIFNLRRRNWTWSAFHAVAVFMDTRAVFLHHKDTITPPVESTYPDRHFPPAIPTNELQPRKAKRYE